MVKRQYMGIELFYNKNLYPVDKNYLYILSFSLFLPGIVSFFQLNVVYTL